MAVVTETIPAGCCRLSLCLRQLRTVLSLGGGPRATTIELAIYQALSYDYDLPRGDAGSDPDGVLPSAGAVGQQRRHCARRHAAARLAQPGDRLHSRICDTVLIVLALLLFAFHRYWR